MRIGDGCSFNSIRTSAYKLHFMESPSGLKVGGCGGWRVLRMAGRVGAVGGCMLWVQGCTGPACG